MMFPVPGWLTVIEERFGRLGRPLTMVLLSLGALAFAALATGVIYQFWGRPLIDLGQRVLEGNSIWPPFATILASMVTVTMSVGIIWLLWRFVFRGKWETLSLRVAVTGKLVTDMRKQSGKLDKELKALREQAAQLRTSDRNISGFQDRILGLLETQVDMNILLGSMSENLHNRIALLENN